MDSKQLNQLDPKLKEAYERVMGTSAAPQPKPSPFIPKPPQSPTSPTQPIRPVTPPPQTAPKTVFPSPAPKPIIQPQPIQIQPSQPQPVKQEVTQNVKKKNKLLPVFIGLGVVFLIGYAFFWIKFFNLKLPFIPF